MLFISVHMIVTPLNVLVHLLILQRFIIHELVVFCSNIENTTPGSLRGVEVKKTKNNNNKEPQHGLQFILVYKSIQM